MLIIAGALLLRSKLHPPPPYSVTLAWKAPDPDPKSKVVGYSISRRTQDGTFTTVASDAPALTYRDERVKAGTAYIYVVQVGE